MTTYKNHLNEAKTPILAEFNSFMEHAFKIDAMIEPENELDKAIAGDWVKMLAAMNKVAKHIKAAKK